MTRAASISNFLEQRIDAGDFPSAVYLVAEKGEIVLQGALGLAVVEPERIEARLDTIYDVASLTKLLVTGLLCAQLIEAGGLTWAETVSRYLPEFDSPEKREITVENLLTHNSGLRGWLPVYLLADDPSQVIDLIAKRPLNYPTGSKVVYSDLNFLALQAIVERHFGQKLDALAEVKIFRPLGLRDTFFNPGAALRSRISASEKGNGFERQTCTEQGYLQPPVGASGSDWFRTETIWGEVHDGNAYFMGGVAGHAGLFSTADEVLGIARQFLPNYTTLLKPETCELFRTNYTAGMNEDRSFAFQLASTPESTAGSKMPPESFGHTGFTGTSLWIDPVHERFCLADQPHAQPRPAFRQYQLGPAAVSRPRDRASRRKLAANEIHLPIIKSALSPKYFFARRPLF